MGSINSAVEVYYNAVDWQVVLKKNKQTDREFREVDGNQRQDQNDDVKISMQPYWKNILEIRKDRGRNNSKEMMRGTRELKQKGNKR